MIYFYSLTLKSQAYIYIFPSSPSSPSSASTDKFNLSFFSGRKFIDLSIYLSILDRLRLNGDLARKSFVKVACHGVSVDVLREKNSLVNKNAGVSLARLKKKEKKTIKKTSPLRSVRTIVETRAEGRGGAN